MRKETRKKIISIVILVIILGIGLWLTSIISTEQGRVEFKDTITKLGFWGVLILIFIQTLQILFVVIPGEPIEIFAGMCYGGVKGTIFILISSMIISTIIYILVKKYGKELIYKIFGKEKVNKLEEKLMRDPAKIEIILYLLFFIPGTPKDLLVYVAMLLPINHVRFIIGSTLMRIPSVISSTLAGEFLFVGDWKVSLLVYGITFLVVGIIIMIIKIRDKNKILTGYTKL